MALFFPPAPPKDVGGLWSAVYNFFVNLGPAAEGRTIYDYELAAGVNYVAHGLKDAPRGVFITPHAQVMVTRGDAPGPRFLYIEAASPVTVDLLVIP